MEFKYCTCTSRTSHCRQICAKNDTNVKPCDTNLTTVILWPGYTTRVLTMWIKPTRCIIFLYVYFHSLHVSGSYVPIIRRNICINATPGICHSVWMTVWFTGWDPILRTRRSSTQSDKYQVSHWYRYFSWLWAHNCPKHVENRNKHKCPCTGTEALYRSYGP